jgi:hypothetical protein
MYLLRSLGAPAVLDESGAEMGLPLGKPLALLVHLTLVTAPVSREELALLLWPEAPRSRALQSVRQAIWLIRRTLGEEVLQGGDPVAVNPAVIQSDVDRIEALLNGDREEEASALAGPAFLEGLSLPDLPTWDRWVEEAGAAARDRVASAFLRRASLHEAAGRATRAAARLGDAQRVRPTEELELVGVALEVGPDHPLESDVNAEPSRSVPSPATGSPAGWDQRGPAWRRVGLVLGSAALLILALVRGSALLSPLPPPLYGGGELWVRSPGGDLVVTPGVASGGGWRMDPPGGFVPEESGAVGPFASPEGTRRWFASRETAEGATTLVELLPDGQEAPQLRLGESGILGDVHPDGRWILHIRPDPSTTGGPGTLTLAADDGSPPRVILRSPTPILLARWSPGGEQFLAVTRGRPDSLLVLSGGGDRRAALSWPTIWSACWIGSGRVVFVGERDGTPRILQWNLSSGSVQPLTNSGPLAAPHLACAPDGSAVVVLSMHDGMPGLDLVPLDGGMPQPLSFPLTQIPASLRWVPTGVRPLITGVTVEQVPGPLRWGEQYPLTARVTWSDGADRDTPVTWHATDPDIVSVDVDGVITTNRPGSSRIIARAGGWRADTLLVEVAALQVTEGVVIREPFEELDSTRWRRLGAPLPRVVDDVAGGPALELRGEGEQEEGVILGTPLALPRGGTVELEFLTEFTRQDRQHIRLVLGTAEPVPDGDPGHWTGWRWDRHLTVTYPEAGPGGRFNPNRIAVEGTGWRFLDIPEEVQQGEWTHLAIQVRPDGEVSFYMNHRYLGTAPGRLPVEPDGEWRVALLGAALDTRLFVRNLVVWGEPRYQSPRLIDQPPGVRAMVDGGTVNRPG